jgi:hypothetical protein
MRDWYSIGSTPNGEKCAQVGSDNYYNLSKKEIPAYLAQLLRHFGYPPTGSWLRGKVFSHEAGMYEEVCYFYDPDSKSHQRYFDIVQNGMENWDREAVDELGTDYFIQIGLPNRIEFDPQLTSEDGLFERMAKQKGFILIRQEDVMNDIMKTRNDVEAEYGEA